MFTNFLLIIGIISVLALILVAFIFCSAARTYINDDEALEEDLKRYQGSHRTYVVRAEEDRRQVIQSNFPLRDSNGIMVYSDRRKLSDRRGLHWAT